MGSKNKPGTGPYGPVSERDSNGPVIFYLCKERCGDLCYTCSYTGKRLLNDQSIRRGFSMFYNVLNCSPRVVLTSKSSLLGHLTAVKGQALVIDSVKKSRETPCH